MSKKTISILIGALVVSCATPIPMKRIRKVHNSNLQTTFSKYRSVFNNHDWDIEQSDGAGGFLKATKPYKSYGIIIGIFKTTLSCNTEGKTKTSCNLKIRLCDNTVQMGNCRPINEYHAKEKDLSNFLEDVGKI